MMKILFTGASSFTGLWFTKALSEAGHAVTTVFPRKKEEYQGLRKERMEQAAALSEPYFSSPFGHPSFLEIIKGSKWDLLCHHAADVTNYRSPEFDVAKALANNTYNLQEVIKALGNRGCSKILLTGSVFEQREGQGTDSLRAVSPYGLSKGLTGDVFRYFCTVNNFDLGKFVIPNPFGPYEEDRFTTYLAKHWLGKKTPVVASPNYIRDNIHAPLLAKAYLFFAEKMTHNKGYLTYHPSGYQESQGDFTARFAFEMEKRWGFSCPFELNKQETFPEPRVRLNTESARVDWDEKAAWDQLADYYKRTYV